MITLAAIWAAVQVSAAFVRSAPDYESPLQTQILMGSVVQADSVDRYWRHVICTDPPYEGWVNDLMLAPIGDDVALDAYVNGPKLICTALHTPVVDDGGRIICELCMGDTVSGTLPGGRGRRVKVTLPSGAKGYVPHTDVSEAPLPAADIHHTAVITAQKMLGAPYLWGGNTPSGLDCSGLTWLSYRMAGLALPRDASQQVRCGEDVPGAISDNGCVHTDLLREGDLVFFGTPSGPRGAARVSHVGIYLGGGRFIHASQTVRISSLDPDSPDFYSSKPAVAVRRL